MSKYDCINVACPKCGSPVGTPCVTVSGNTSLYAHTSRQALSHKPMRDDQCAGGDALVPRDDK
jgi:hypothetical protein